MRGVAFAARCVSVVVLGFASVALAPAALAYEVVSIADGGTISGIVTLKGKAPPPKIIEVKKTPDVCGEEDRTLAEVSKGPNGGLADVVLYITDIKQGKPFVAVRKTGGPEHHHHHSSTTFQTESGIGGNKLPDLLLEPRHCLFGAFTGVVANGSIMRFNNKDSVKHSPHAYALKGRVRKSIFNQDLEGNGTLELPVNLKQGVNIIRLECGQHNHMQNWYYRVENPYYAFSGTDGKFTIDNVPPGDYEILAWHPKARKGRRHRVTVSAGGTSEVNFEFVAKKGRMK
jgi:hypothetical protein